jgi:hypothetical protein
MSGSSRTRTGTRGKPAKVSRLTQRSRTLTRLEKKEFTTASSSVAWRDTLATLTTTPLGNSPSGAPEKPKVDIGPKSYRTYKSYAQAVIRFFVVEKRGRWLVFDMCSSNQFAAKTSSEGYATKKEAVSIARKYRDDYGAYAKVPF